MASWLKTRRYLDDSMDDTLQAIWIYLVFFFCCFSTLEYSSTVIVRFGGNLSVASIRKRHQSTSTWILPLITGTGALCKHHVEPRNAWLPSSELCTHIFLNLHFEPFQLSPEFWESDSVTHLISSALKKKKKKAKFNYHLNGKGIFFFLLVGEKSLKFPAEERKPC